MLTLREYQKAWYQKHRKDKLAQNKRWQDKNSLKWKAYLAIRRKSHADIIIAHKNRPCADCLGWFDPVQMDFDHVTGTKKGNLSQMSAQSVKAIMSEIAKCEVVCANCHRLRTLKRGEYRYYATTI